MSLFHLAFCGSYPRFIAFHITVHFVNVLLEESLIFCVVKRVVADIKRNFVVT